MHLKKRPKYLKIVIEISNHTFQMVKIFFARQVFQLLAFFPENKFRIGVPVPFHTVKSPLARNELRNLCQTTKGSFF